MQDTLSFEYFLTYKLSQDHIQLFFTKIRLHGGFNNIPSVQQFKAGIRSLILNKRDYYRQRNVCQFLQSV